MLSCVGSTQWCAIYDCSTRCFKCVQIDHFRREWPKNRQGNGNRGNRAKYSSISPRDKAASKGATTLGVGWWGNCLYIITSCLGKEDSSDFITRKIHVFHINVYALVDAGASLFLWLLMWRWFFMFFLIIFSRPLLFLYTLVSLF